MLKDLILTEKTVFGNDLVYPSCEQSIKIAKLLGVKSFNSAQLLQLKSIGFVLNIHNKKAV
jgi:hypothetical protein